jgi:CheY-like chemotaxis protein
MQILIVDDDRKSVEPLQEEIRKTFVGFESMIVGFKDSTQVIEHFKPHVVVLDIMQGNPSDNDAAGLSTCDFIWHARFCPLVFYTAVPEHLEGDERLPHPLVKTVKKGANSELIVISHIRDFQPHVLALAATVDEIQAALNRALRDVARRVFENTEDARLIPDALTRASRRRVAAAMDEALSSGGPNLRSWEHYLCPPTGSHLLTGDILRKKEGNPGDPLNYRVVLTPSCDLVEDGERHPNVEKVLTAICFSAERLTSELGLEPVGGRNKWKNKLVPILRQGYWHSCLPIPALPGEFPTMTADFCRLELISVDQIGNGDKEYLRIASVDNPFRELVAWAYVVNAARPGMPEREFEKWADEITAAVPVREKKPEK